MTSGNPCGARHIRPQASGLPRRSQLRRLMGRVGQPRRHPHRNLTAPFPLPVVLADAGTHPPARHSSAPLRVRAVREPPVPFPSLTTRHSQLSTAEPRNLVVVAPPPSRAPPVVLADAGTHPPARHSSAPLRVGAVREPPVPFPSLTTRHSERSTAESRNLVVVASPSLPRPSRCPRGCGDPSPCPSFQRPTPSRGGSRTARPLPLSNHPSFPAKHSRAEESRCRSTPSLPRPSRCPRGCGDPSPCPSFQRPTPRRGGSRTARPLPLSNHPSFPAKHSRVEESRCLA